VSMLCLDGVVTKDPEVLRDPDRLRQMLYGLAENIGMKPVSYAYEAYAHWTDGAPSAVVFIEESAIVAHTYPEANFIELTLHSCKPIPNEIAVALGVIHYLGLDVRFHESMPLRNWRDLARRPARRHLWPKEIRDASATVSDVQLLRERPLVVGESPSP
jgi:S-adenosylmethionine/arginine decarboxylase-like enzyme